MPSYFYKQTQNGIIVTSCKITNKLQYWEGPDVINKFDHPMGLDLKGKSNDEFMQWILLPEIRFGFVVLKNPSELNLEFGDEVPLVITDKKCKQDYFPEFIDICWASPE